MTKIAIFTIGHGDFNNGFTIGLEIREERGNSLSEVMGKLPPSPSIPELYEIWRRDFINIKVGNLRMKVSKGKSNAKFSSVKEAVENCRISQKNLKNSFKDWLTSESRELQKMRETFFKNLPDKFEEIRVFIQTRDPFLKKLPWNEWNIFEEYAHAEIALAPPEYNQIYLEPDAIAHEKVRILAILGTAKDINTEQDKKELEGLLDAETWFLNLNEPAEVYDAMQDEMGWDILYFAGHSDSSPTGETGRFFITDEYQLTITELKTSLQTAITRGLQLAIFNSCDGLGLAKELADLNIPQVIVMREPMPGDFAVAFIKKFLQKFYEGKSLYLAMREAKDSLECWETQYPGVSWLPILCQHPLAPSLTWQGIRAKQQIDTPQNRQEYHNRKTLLQKVKKYWIQGVLENSLPRQLSLDLQLEQYPFVKSAEIPRDNLDKTELILLENTRLIQYFDQLKTPRTLLILGEPGSGKTVTLLELAQDAIARAERDYTQSIPLVFTLSSWGLKRLPIKDWIIKEGKALYSLSPSWLKSSLEKGRLLLLLDGLDEVPSKKQKFFLNALNTFIEQYPLTEFIVTSRREYYEKIKIKLNLKAAIYLQPLSLGQICEYIANLGNEYSINVAKLQSDPIFLKFATTPLNLHIIGLVYKGYVENQPKLESLEARRRWLINQRWYRHLSEKGPSYTEEIIHWLSGLTELMITRVCCWYIGSSDFLVISFSNYLVDI